MLDTFLGLTKNEPVERFAQTPQVQARNVKLTTYVHENYTEAQVPERQLRTLVTLTGHVLQGVNIPPGISKNHSLQTVVVTSGGSSPVTKKEPLEKISVRKAKVTSPALSRTAGSAEMATHERPVIFSTVNSSDLCSSEGSTSAQKSNTPRDIAPDPASKPTINVGTEQSGMLNNSQSFITLSPWYSSNAPI